jgi:hypothetical protein
MDCLSFGRAFGTHIKTAGPANIADAHGSSYVPYIGGAISGAVKPHPSRNAFRSSMGEGLAGLSGGVKGTLLGAGTSAALNLLTRGKLGLKSNALAGILGGSAGTHMGSQWHREDLPLNARALAEMGRSAGSKKASGEFNPTSWNQGYNTGTSSANNHNIHALASGGLLGGVAGLATEAMREKNEEEKNQSLLRKVLRYAASGGAGAAGGAGAMGALGALTAPGQINLHSKSSSEKVSGLGDMLGAVTKKLPMKPIAASGKPVASAAPARLSEEAAQRQVLQQKIPGMGDAVTFPRKPLPAGRVVDLPEIANGLKLAKDEKLANFGRFVGAGMNAARNAIGAGSQMAGQAVTGAMNAAKPMVNNALNTAGQAVTGAVNAAKPVLNSATTAVKNTLNTPGRQIAATTAAGVGGTAAAIPVAQHFENKRIDAQVDRQRARLAQPQQPSPKLAFDSTTGEATLIEPQPTTLTGNKPQFGLNNPQKMPWKQTEHGLRRELSPAEAASFTAQSTHGIDPKKIQESWSKHFDKYGPEGQKPGFVG